MSLVSLTIPVNDWQYGQTKNSFLFDREVWQFCALGFYLRELGVPEEELNKRSTLFELSLKTQGNLPSELFVFSSIIEDINDSPANLLTDRMRQILSLTNLRLPLLARLKFKLLLASSNFFEKEFLRQNILKTLFQYGLHCRLRFN